MFIFNEVYNLDGNTINSDFAVGDLDNCWGDADIFRKVCGTMEFGCSEDGCTAERSFDLPNNYVYELELLIHGFDSNLIFVFKDEGVKKHIV